MPITIDRRDRRARLGENTELGGDSPAQVVSNPPGVGNLKDNLGKFAKENRGILHEEAIAVAHEVRELTKALEPKIRRAIRLAFVEELRNFSELRKVENTLSAQIEPAALEQIRDTITALHSSSPAIFEAKSQREKITLLGEEKCALDFLTHEHREKVFSLHKRLGAAFDDEKQRVLDDVNKSIRRFYELAEGSLITGQLAMHPDLQRSGPSLEECVGAIPSILSRPETPSGNTHPTEAQRDMRATTRATAPSLDTRPNAGVMAMNVTGNDSRMANAFTHIEVCSFGGLANRKMLQGLNNGDVNGVGTITHHEPRGSAARAPDWGSERQTVLSAALVTARALYGVSSEEGGKLRLARGLMVVSHTGAPSDARTLLGKASLTYNGKLKAEELETVNVTFIPPRLLFTCGENFKPGGDQPFIVTISAAMPKADAEQLRKLMQDTTRDPSHARNALLSLINNADVLPRPVSDVVTRLRDAIFLPLARALNEKIPEGKPWWDLHDEQRKAAVGMFDAVEGGNGFETRLRKTLRVE